MDQNQIPNKTHLPLKSHYSMQELLDIMALLRAPDGCPWDREQTHRSLKPHLIEEAYEAIDAIDSENPERLCDELGDVLMQVVFHAQIASENDQFDFSDVMTAISRKLISRHTHIFGDDQAATAEEVLATWEKNKRQEKGQKRQSEVLADLPRHLPALQRSYKIQQRAARVGFDWPDPSGPLDKIHEELAEIVDCLAGSNSQDADGRVDQSTGSGATLPSEHLMDEVGDLLFAVVNYARHLGVQPELALDRASNRFVQRFSLMEHQAEAAGDDLADLTLEQLDQLWDQAKEKEKAK
ncbi:MAG: nucleoside triphosphate pyrophosphohydrolase [Eubacteriales bacterium]|nr:nucleoside triphosphate pyrophosphohydrolase [Eubacteriales bacterium]MDD4461624.1 nucleoside triphosphate pyrophosphohydrolase [Eubacteriales bacterium]